MITNVVALHIVQSAVDDSKVVRGVKSDWRSRRHHIWADDIETTEIFNVIIVSQL